LAAFGTRKTDYSYFFKIFCGKGRTQAQIQGWKFRKIRFFPEKSKKRLTLTGFILYNTWCVIGSGKSSKARARAGVNNSFDQEV